MNTRFALPIAAALAVHATLLFGFRKSPYTRPVNTTPVVKESPPFKIEEEIEIVEVECTSALETRREVSRPEIPDSPRPVEHADFTTPLAPPAPPRMERQQTIDIGNYGSPGNGNIDIGSVVPVTGLDNPPTTRSQFPPDYPYSAKSSGLTGEVWVQFVVDTSGRVHDAVVVRSTDRIFEEATVRAVSKWRFEPGKRGGRIVSFRMVAPVVFSLNGE